MKEKPSKKYQAFPQIKLQNRQWPDKVIDQAPLWCSVDLRDGNQALAIPMNIEEKLEMFDLLVKIGFKQIEVGFPSASDTEFNFLRRLVDEDRIPEDVTVQVLTQAREHLIRRTFESLKGTKQAIVHLYNSTSPLQRKVTFRMSKEQIRDIAVEGTRLVKSLVDKIPETKIQLEYSPESFSDTEVDYALEVCQAVMDVWEPTKTNPVILNLPATVEVATPNVHADQIEWFCQNLKNRDCALISLHTHNDRGTGIAATELGLLAGADRVEGTLFGNGERTGNLDIVTVALNMYTQGVNPELDFSEIEKIRQIYERCTRMKVHERHPYSGDLVFTAFSGSHQDAIKKGFDRNEKKDVENELWEVPYLLIDPSDIGRSYEAIIRINSQSGKGGVAYILRSEYGFDMPKVMHMDVGTFVNAHADSLSRELTPVEILEVFKKEFVNRSESMSLKTYSMSRNGDNTTCTAELVVDGQVKKIEGEGNGPINAFVMALESAGLKNFTLSDYRQHAIGEGSATDSAAYIQLTLDCGTQVFGCGMDANIEQASLNALICACNRIG